MERTFQSFACFWSASTKCVASGSKKKKTALTKLKLLNPKPYTLTLLLVCVHEVRALGVEEKEALAGDDARHIRRHVHAVKPRTHTRRPLKSLLAERERQ